jgi:hypothetical protein
MLSLLVSLDFSISIRFISHPRFLALRYCTCLMMIKHVKFSPNIYTTPWHVLRTCCMKNKLSWKFFHSLNRFLHDNDHVPSEKPSEIAAFATKGRIDNVLHISRWMKQMVILPSTLANQTWQIPEAVNIFSYLLPQPVDCTVSKKKNSNRISSVPSGI